MSQTGTHADHFQANRANWSERALIHRHDRSGFYGTERFLGGEDVLGPIEAAEIGDVAGKSILHLQCHFGLDSLSLARRGAAVTGLDFSATAIEEARKLCEASGVDARFVEGNVYDAPDLVQGRFDMVYVTWGTICWLPDIVEWARIVAGFLKPGGTVYLADSHPFVACFEEVGGDLKPTYGWRTPQSRPLFFDEATSYTGTGTLTNTRSYEWIHPVSDILNGLIGVGLVLVAFNEHERLPWPFFAMMRQAGEGLWKMPDHVPPFPLAFSLKAAKPDYFARTR